MVVVVALSTVLILSIAAQTSWSFWRSAKSMKSKLYEDQDGSATEDSQASYARTVRIVRFSLTASWAVGISLSLSAAIHGIVNSWAFVLLDWGGFASWVS